MHSERLTLSHAEQTGYFLSLRQGRRIVDPGFISSQMNISKSYATDILYTLAKKGVAVRIGRGLYLLVNPEVIYGRKSFAEDPLLVIDELMAQIGRVDYYVAYASAAQVHGIAHQLPLSLTVAVTKRRNDIDAKGIKVHFVTVRKELAFGIEKKKYLMDRVFRVSDLEKTILDCLERTDLSGGASDVARMISDSKENINWEKLAGYAHKFNNYALMQRLGYILDKLVESGEIVLQPSIMLQLSKSVEGKAFAYPLEPRLGRNARRRSDKINRKWMIIENTDVMEWRQ